MESLPTFALALATLIYLIVDIYPNVKSFRAILQTGSFWLLWLIFVVLNLIAWGALEVAMSKSQGLGRPSGTCCLVAHRAGNAWHHHDLAKLHAKAGGHEGGGYRTAGG